MPSQQKGHKWFAAYWDRMLKMEPRGMQELRDHAVAGLSGRVLEIGAGTGGNFSRYPRTVTDLVATEPDPYMLERARKRASGLKRTVELHEAPAERLPFEDASFDAVVSMLVLCSVEDSARAFAEIKRVLKPGGELRFLEHVRYDGWFGGAFQDLLTPAWRWLGAGCSPNRRTGEAIADAGFTITEIHRFKLAPPIPPLCVTRPGIVGTALNS